MRHTAPREQAKWCAAINVKALIFLTTVYLIVCHTAANGRGGESGARVQASLPESALERLSASYGRADARLAHLNSLAGRGIAIARDDETMLGDLLGAGNKFENEEMVESRFSMAGVLGNVGEENLGGIAAEVEIQMVSFP